MQQNSNGTYVENLHSKILLLLKKSIHKLTSIQELKLFKKQIEMVDENR